MVVDPWGDIVSYMSSYEYLYFLNVYHTAVVVIGVVVLTDAK